MPSRCGNEHSFLRFDGAEFSREWYYRDFDKMMMIRNADRSV